MTTADQRLETLELKLMELENAIAELNDVIINQYREIDALKSDQRRLLTQLETLQQSGPDSADERPPHY